MGFPEIRGSPFGALRMRTAVFWESILGSPDLGKLPNGRYSSGR